MSDAGPTAPSWTLLLALASSSCLTEPATQLLVAVDTDIDRGSLLHEVEVEVQDATGRTTFDRATFRVGPTAAPGGVLAIPFTFGVSPRDEDASDDVRVVLRGRFADSGARVRVSAVALTGYRRNRKLALPMFLAGSCVDHEGCTGETTCQDGACAPVARIDPARLQDVTGAAYAPPPRPAADAGADVPCPADQRACGGRCVDLQAETFHCGRCGNACADGSRCAGGTCVSIGGCGPPYLPAGSTQCVVDYETGLCNGGSATVGCGVMPEACRTGRGSMPARVYSNHYEGEIITLPRAARRVRFSIGGTGGAYCWLRLLDASGASLLQPEPRMNCTHPTDPTFGADVDFTAPASSAGVTRLWLDHISSATCYLSAIDVAYDR